MMVVCFRPSVWGDRYYRRLSNTHSESSRSGFWKHSLSPDKGMDLCCWDESKEARYDGRTSPLIQLGPTYSHRCSYGREGTVLSYKDAQRLGCKHGTPRDWRGWSWRVEWCAQTKGCWQPETQRKDQPLSCRCFTLAKGSDFQFQVLRMEAKYISRVFTCARIHAHQSQ